MRSTRYGVSLRKKIKKMELKVHLLLMKMIATTLERINNIEFEEVKIDLAKRQHLSQEFAGVKIDQIQRSVQEAAGVLNDLETAGNVSEEEHSCSNIRFRLWMLRSLTNIFMQSEEYNA
ncbi:uncharacterized protein [Spinacia oleracea]|uniref:Uncharacterized protein isoform X3 n=1 Tax=Spinacia oleracea TaxID=3562 RepID=A0ABM3RUK8_SPIOL|nr:uncharacterized protein LOC110803544 isoform X3 [Spinacia oleracea]